MRRLLRQLFWLCIHTCFIIMLRVGVAHAQVVPTFSLHGITIKPYATDQLDVGGFPSASPNRVDAGARGARMRNGMRLNIHKQVEVGAIWDFGPAPGGPMRLFEGQVSYIGLRHFVFTAGIFKPSFGLESMQAQGDTVFVERSSISTLTRNLATGIERQAVQAETYGKRYHFAFSATAGTAGPGENGNQRAMAFRLVGLPLRTRSLLFHIGFSGEWVFRPASARNAAPTLSLSDNPELNPGTISKYLNTGKILSNSAGAFGVEAAVAWEKLLFQGEAYDILLNSDINASNQQLHFHGWYGQFGYTINGKQREWKGRTAAFSSPSCDRKQRMLCSGYGVLEVAGRYSEADLEAGPIHGGDQQTVALAVNWWPTEIIRTTLQYEYGQITGSNTPEHFHAIMSMLQIKF